MLMLQVLVVVAHDKTITLFPLAGFSMLEQ